MKKGYKFLFLKLLASFAMLFFFDFGVGKLLKYMYFRQTSGWEYRTIYSVENTKAAILIFGASRAQEQYNPIFFEAALHQSCYNVGRDGVPIFYHYAVLKGILKRYTPKVIFLDVENSLFRNKQSDYDRLSLLLPFYNDHPEMRPTIELKSPYEKVKLLSQIYPYNSLLFKMAIGNMEMNRSRNEDFKGYVPLNSKLDQPVNIIDLSIPYSIDSNKLNCFKSFIKDCEQANIKLYLVAAPYFSKFIGVDTSMVLVKKIASEKKIDIIDFSQNDMFTANASLFGDMIHVNVEGAKLFSKMLADSILSKTRTFQ